MKPSLLLQSVFLMLALSLAVGCSGLQRPVSPEDYVQSARAQLGAIYQTIGDLKAEGSITQAQTQAAIVKTERAEVELDQATALLRGGKAVNAQQLAGTALAVLLEVQATLPKPKGK